MKSALYFKDNKGKLQSVTYDSVSDDLIAVKDQMEIKTAIKAMTGTQVAAHTPVLCLLQK